MISSFIFRIIIGVSLILVVLKLDRPLSGKIIFLIVILVQTSGAIDTKVQMSGFVLDFHGNFISLPSYFDILET